MQRIRSFVAIVLPVEVKAALDGYTQTLRGAVPAGVVRWVPAANIHLTLSFLGEVDEAALPAVKAALRRVAAAHPPHTLRVGGVGCFPGAAAAAAAPRVVWAGVEEGSGALAALQTDVAACLVPLGFPKERRPFSPHLTLGRVADRPSRQQKRQRRRDEDGADGEGSSGNDRLQTLAQALGDSGSFGDISPTSVGGFSLMRSDAGKDGGRVYASQADFELLGTSVL